MLPNLVRNLSAVIFVGIIGNTLCYCIRKSIKVTFWNV